LQQRKKFKDLNAMPLHIDLRCNPSGLAETPEYTKAADGVVSIIYDEKKCYSAWIEYNLDPLVPATTSKTIAVLIPSDSTNAYSPYMEAGCKYKIKASMAFDGHFKAKIIE
jgi:hypothetical protein